MILPKEYSKIEFEIYQFLVNNFITKTHCEIYKSITHPMDKMIAFYLYDQDYSVNQTSSLIGRCRCFVWQRTKVIKKQLAGYRQQVTL